ncbi:MAG: hypothetical protein EXS05_15435 [Planctomycetaceae bacterium]|nr:hypothetical protein [Planctomycetaceae bacterium]
MPRLLVVVLVTLVALLLARPLAAKDETGPNLGGRLARLREEQTRKSPTAQQLIYERARRRARERALRLESYRRMGYSPNRPMVPYTKYGVDLNQGLHNSWGASSFPSSW